MIELATLGDLRIRGPGGHDYESVLSQPKRLALLAYLAIAYRGGFARRDTILALFWPELDEAHARGALRQSTRFLRRALGPEVLVSRGADELGTDERVLWCDAVAFDEACDAGELARATDLYSGELLKGLHISDASSDLGRWLEDERYRLRRRASQTAWALVDCAEADGSVERAAACARHALGLFPDDEAGFRRMITLLDRLGDRDGALHAYETFARRLAEDHEVGPAAETLALMAAVRARTPSGSSHKAAAVLPAAAARSTGAPESAQPATPDHPQGREAPREKLRVRPRERSPLLIGFVAAAALGAIAIVALVTWPRKNTPLESNVIAVAPWRVSGADSSLSYLREGMVDLLGATLTGEGGPRAVDPRTALSAWHRAASYRESDLDQNEALRTARRLGADHLLLGEVVGSPARIMLNATLLSVESGHVRVRTVATGPADSLMSIVDELTARLLVLESGEGPHRLAAGTSTSLPALRAYLQGRAAYRRGGYREAVEHFSLALDRDSTFALAGWGLAAAAGWLGTGTGALASAEHRGLRIALAWQQRLSPRDRALVRAEAGDRYPEPAWVGHCLDAWGRALDLAPDQPEAWFWFGDCFYHSGALLAIKDAPARATKAFQRSLELDSSVAGPLAHLVEITARNGDGATTRRLFDLYLARDSTADAADYMRWRVAIALGDSAALQALRRRFDRMALSSLHRIVTAMQLDGVGLADADAVASALWRSPQSPSDSATSASLLWDFAVTRGHTQEALAAGQVWLAVQGSRREYLERTIGNALYADGDTSIAVDALRELAEMSAGEATRGAAPLQERPSSLCARSLWEVAHGRTSAASAAIHRLRMVTASPDTGGIVGKSALCAATLAALLEATLKRGDAAPALHHLDTLAVLGALSFPVTWHGGENLIIAQLLEASGDVPRALAVVRRRGYGGLGSTRFLSSYLREEGRLSALAGDREGAIRAYKHYLALRSHAAPSVRADVELIRARLAQLEQGPHR